jgi:hypothetical protein
MNKELTQHIDEAFAELETLTDSFLEPLINEVPFEGSWTPGQVADHILKSQKGVLELLYGKTAPADRDPGQFIGHLRDVFMDFSSKMTSPDFVLPSNKPLEKSRLIERIKTARVAWKEILKTHDLTLLYTDFTLPGSPPMTGIEWTHFVLYHTKRHNNQLKNIADRVNQLT